MVRDHGGLAVVPLHLRRLLLKYVARERVTAADLALGGQLEALLGAGMALHLGHRSREVKQRTAFARRVTGSGQADAQPAALPLPTRFNGAMARGMLTVRTNGRGETILEAHRWPESGIAYVCSSVCAHRE